MQHIIDEAKGHLGAAIGQSIDSRDDRIIMEHVRIAHALLGVVRLDIVVSKDALDIIDRWAMWIVAVSRDMDDNDDINRQDFKRDCRILHQQGLLSNIPSD